MRSYGAIIAGKLIKKFSVFLGFGAGATWPGEVTLCISPHILSLFTTQIKKGIILVAGTNGKTTTSLMIKDILEGQGLRVVHNASGANLLNGVVSACISQSSWRGKLDADWGVFEVDENSLSIVIDQLSSPTLIGDPELDSRFHGNDKKRLVVVLLNLFRDQLDRYGEVDVIAEKWNKALGHLSRATVILNADDPLVAHLGKNLTDVIYFGIEDRKQFIKEKEHATDSTFCLNCGSRLSYEGVYFSHLGMWSCPNCGERRPRVHFSKGISPLSGLYNWYNTLATVAVTKTLGISQSLIDKTLSEFKPAFGRQEEFLIEGKRIVLFLSKNPTGFNASLRTVLEFKPKVLLLILNDRIPDGRDVSWVWDVDFETIPGSVNVVVSGDRVYDMALRMKYAQNIKNQKLFIEPNLKIAIGEGLKQLKKGETLYILPTYSAMLEVRKILTGRKIL